MAVAALGPVGARAQDDEEWQEFTSDDEKLTLQYPDGWAIQENGPELGLPGVTLANSDETMESMNEGGDLAEGNLGVVIFLLPTDLLGFMGMDLVEDFEAIDLAEALGQSFAEQEPDSSGMATDEPEMAVTEESSGPQVGEPETFETEDGLEIGYVSVTDESSEGAILAYELKEGIVVLAVVGAFPGEYSDDVRDQVLEILDSVQYEGTGDELMNALMGGMGGADVEAPTEEATPEAGS
jgi:hypothetical protein